MICQPALSIEVEAMLRLTENHKISVIQRALITKQKLVLLEFHLRTKGQDVDAQMCASKGVELQAEIDVMLGEAMDAWRARAETLVTGLGDINNKLQSSILQIKKNVATAQNLIKALELVDDAIALIRTLALA